jgi:hypothetical protein
MGHTANITVTIDASMLSRALSDLRTAAMREAIERREDRQTTTTVGGAGTTTVAPNSYSWVWATTGLAYDPDSARQREAELRVRIRQEVVEELSQMQTDVPAGARAIRLSEE